jgi:hypothetical protein
LKKAEPFSPGAGLRPIDAESVFLNLRLIDAGRRRTANIFSEMAFYSDSLDSDEAKGAFGG